MFLTLTYLRHFNLKKRKINVSRKFQVGPITAELLARFESTMQATLFNT